MLKKNKFSIILSSLILLLPILLGIFLWNDLPDTMTTHWGADGNPDGFSGKAFAVFGLPCIFLVLHFICLLATLCDKKQTQQNAKALRIVFWILPAISLFANGIMYRAAFGLEFDMTFFLPVLFGLMFLFLGNYLPKITQNRTLGIKISWTLNNEENWNKTHRFTGKLWVIGGLAVLLSLLLPMNAAVWVMVGVLAVAVILPFLYSYRIYRQHKKAGIVYDTKPKSKGEKVAVTVSAIVLPILLIGIGVLMFTGKVEVQCNETSFAVHATYWTDIEVDYSEIDAVSYREMLDVGVRTNGFASARLSLGIFQNEEFGTYTLYAFTGAKEFVVLTSGEKTLVIGLNHRDSTRELYETVLTKIGK